MRPCPALQALEIDTEDVRQESNLVELMRTAFDDTNRFMSRRARQILWDKFRIAVTNIVLLVVAV